MASDGDEMDDRVGRPRRAADQHPPNLTEDGDGRELLRPRRAAEQHPPNLTEDGDGRELLRQTRFRRMVATMDGADDAVGDGGGEVMPSDETCVGRP